MPTRTGLSERMETLPSGALVPAVSPPPNPPGIEWPTIMVIACFFGLLGLVIAYGETWPLPITLLALGLLGAWYGSIQHEAVHGHPTPWPRVNLVLTQAPLCLLYPFWLYRDLHLIHHRDENLTDPELDPESMYDTPGDWERANPVYRSVRNINQTLIGRLVIGPALCTHAVLRHLLRRIRTGDNRAGVARWAVAVTIILLSVDSLGLPAWKFALGFGYIGLSITFIRSFAEHRAVDDATPCAVVRSRWFWGLLFLSVNLHVTHHHNPSLSWYEVRRKYREGHDDQLAADGAGLYSGYPTLIARFLFRRVEQVPYPLSPIAD